MGESIMGMSNTKQSESKVQVITKEDEAMKKKAEEMQSKIQDLEETLQANNLIMQEYEKSFEEKLKEEK